VEKLIEGHPALRKGVTLRIFSRSKDQYTMEAFDDKSDKKYVIVGPNGKIR